VKLSENARDLKAGVTNWHEFILLLNWRRHGCSFFKNIPAQNRLASAWRFD